ncbi:MAG: CHAT domain-containing protein [Rhodothermales bacterium]
MVRTDMEYLDFELRIALTGEDAYRVSVIRSPDGVGEPEGTMRLPARDAVRPAGASAPESAGEVAIHRDAERRKRHQTRPDQAAAFGKQLFDALLPAAIRESYRESRVLARVQGKGLRIRLRIETPDAALVPWEFLYDEKDNFGPLSLSRETLLTRYLELAGAAPALRVAPPLRILGMVASPADLVQLDVDREKRLMEQSVQHLVERGYVHLTWLEGPSWRDLMQAMRKGPWHVFHFIGHGEFDEATQEGAVFFADEAGKTDPLPASKLADLLTDHASLQLVVLNACEGSRASAHYLFSSTGAVLMQRGIPSVVAMQYEITDRAAVEFSRTFYDTLADGEPVDVSVTEARKAISMADRDSAEWGTPVLHMRSPDGRLFDLDMTSAIFKEHGRPSPPAAAALSTQGREGTSSKIPGGLQILKKKMQQFWIEGVLENSLLDRVMIDLGLELMQGAVEDPFGMMVDQAGAESEPLPAGRTLADVFEEQGGSLLILGDPGSGKTTAMLKLASTLLDEIEARPSSPTPVMFNLSSWSTSRLPLMDWMIDELGARYQIPKKVGRLWLEGRQLLPLLDGLDEVGAASRAACVETINAFAASSGVGIAVCCRIKEYIELPVRLGLNSAVRLQQLSRDQVMEYIARGGERLAALRSVIEKDSAMLIDARTPLMLSLMIRAYQDIPIEALEHEALDTQKQRRKQLMDAFCDRMLRRAGY